jgi:hypothetical protein
MKKTTNYFLLFFTVLIISSCASTNSGTFASSATLNAANFKYVKLIKGTSETTKFLGMGGEVKDALLADAKANMYENYPLKDNQAYANICVDYKYSSYLVIIKTVKVTITADIVEFNK